MRSKLKYESAAEAAQRTKLDKLERKQRRYEIMDELMKCATNIKHLISPMFRYKITQQYLWKVLCEARKEGILSATSYGNHRFTTGCRRLRPRSRQVPMEWPAGKLKKRWRKI